MALTFTIKVLAFLHRANVADTLSHRDITDVETLVLAAQNVGFRVIHCNRDNLGFAGLEVSCAPVR